MVPSAHSTESASELNPEAAGFSTKRLQRLSDVLRDDIENARIPGAVVLLIRNGKQAYHEAFGYADCAARRTMRLDSIFRIASMSKPLTVLAALVLMERGKLLLTDAVSRYIPEFRDLRVGVERVDSGGTRRLELAPTSHAMTVHDLMRHTAGFTYGQFGDSLVQRAYRAAQLMDNEQTNDELIAKLARLPLAYQPSTTFEYGMSTDVLGCLVERVADATLESVFAEFVTAPLGMTDTGFRIPTQEVERLAEPQRDAGCLTEPAVLTYDPARPTRWHSGGGGLLSTARDYARFCEMLLNEGVAGGTRIVARKTVRLMLSNHLPADIYFGPLTAELGIAAPLPALGQSYGLGLGLRTAEGLSPVSGSIGDFSWGGASGPYFWVDPLEQLVAVFMLQELNVQRRIRYRPLMRALVYQALR